MENDKRPYDADGDDEAPEDADRAAERAAERAADSDEGDEPAEGDGDAALARPPSADALLGELESGSVPAYERLRGLSDASDEAVARFMRLRPKLSPERRREVLATLQQLADEDVTLDFHRLHLTALADDDAATRILAVRGLWHEERPEYMRLLAERLKSEAEPAVRAEIAHALGPYVLGLEFGMLAEDDADLLAGSLREVVEDIEESEEVRGSALESIGAHSEEWVAELISEAYELGTNRMRLASIRAMGRNASDDWLPVLIYNFDDEDVQIRTAAATAAGELLLPDAVDPLTMLIEEDAEEEVQLAAIAALGEIASPDAERVLLRLARQPEEEIREAAREALARLRLMAFDFLEDEEASADDDDDDEERPAE